MASIRIFKFGRHAARSIGFREQRGGEDSMRGRFKWKRLRVLGYVASAGWGREKDWVMEGNLLIIDWNTVRPPPSSGANLNSIHPLIPALRVAALPLLLTAPVSLLCVPASLPFFSLHWRMGCSAQRAERAPPLLLPPPDNKALASSCSIIEMQRGIEIAHVLVGVCHCLRFAARCREEGRASDTGGEEGSGGRWKEK